MYTSVPYSPSVCLHMLGINFCLSLAFHLSKNIYFSIYLSLHIGKEKRISVHLRPIQSISMPAHVGYQLLILFIYQSIYLSIYLPLCLSNSAKCTLHNAHTQRVENMCIVPPTHTFHYYS